jgi:hypothetical protein
MNPSDLDRYKVRCASRTLQMLGVSLLVLSACGPPGFEMDGGADTDSTEDGVAAAQVNLAVGKPVTVSAALADSPASRLVDQVTSNLWNSGGPAPGWAKIDLQQQSTVSRVRLMIAQQPAGPTVHHVRLLSELGNVLAQRTVSGTTVDGQWLELAFSPAVDGVRSAQVYTQVSPSWVAWREFEVLGSPTPASRRPADQPRGLSWVKKNRMFVSGLTVDLKPPAADVVHEYYDAFGANANHYWETGLPYEETTWASAGRSDYRFLAWTLPNGHSRGLDAIAGGVLPALPGRIGYQVSDEPSGMAPLREINDGLKALRPFDPGALLVVNFPYDNKEINAMLDYNCGEMDSDVISYDRYTYAQGKAHDVLARFRNAGLRCKRPYWRYLKAYHEPKDDSIDESDLRWDAFSGLTYGYTGHTWFIYQATFIKDVQQAFYATHSDFRAPKIVYWSVAAQVNRELKNLGRAVTQLTSTDVRYVPALSLWRPSSTTKWSRGAGGDQYLSAVKPTTSNMDLLVGFFKDDAGETYLMIQNQRHQHADFPNQSKGSGSFKLSFDFQAAPANVDRTALLSLNKVTGQIDRVPLAGEGNSRSVSLTLAAGDPVLLKYATSAPFALQP